MFRFLEDFGGGKLEFEVLRRRLGLVSVMIVNGCFGMISLALNGVIGEVMVSVRV